MRTFSVTWDYRCPFARIVHEQVIDALEGGADWDVTFVPFCLGQVHVEEGDADIWDRPDDDSGLLALQAGVVVRDQHPDRFLAAHRHLFDLRHEQGKSLRDRDAVAGALTDAGVDADAVLAAIDGGGPLEIVRAEHETAAKSHEVWGVPTFLVDDQAVFARLMKRSNGDAAYAKATIERVLDQITGFPELNEFKHTAISH
jgi:2-hydroxychromene-2-carboxylate isomerase